MSSISSAAGVGPSDLSPRLKLVNIVPAAALALLIATLLLAGAPQSAPSPDRLLANGRALGPGWLAALSVAITIWSIALQPFEMSLIRALEGYWPASRLFSEIGQRALWLQRRRHRALRHAALSELNAPEVVAARGILAQWPKDEADVLPMALGNRLRAMERRAAAGYGMDAVRSFPRLYLALPASALVPLGQARDQLDAAVRFCFVFAVGSVVSAGLLAAHGWWLLLPLGLAVMSVTSYRAALVAAVNYGALVTAAFNVYHLRLLDETGVLRPTDTAAVRRAHIALEALQTGDSTRSVRYAPK